VPAWLGKLSQRLAALRGRQEPTPTGPDQASPDRSAGAEIGAELKSQAPLREMPSSRPEAVRQLIEHNRELRELYARHGSVPALERQANRLMVELLALIRADIADFAAFQQTLRAFEQKTDLATPSEFTGATPGGERPMRNKPDDLLAAVLDVLDDRQAVIALLNRDAVHESLPFIECLPFYAGGKLTWRTPARHTLIRKRPTDVRRFAQLLDELERLFHTVDRRRQQPGCRQVLDAIAAVRRSLHQDDAYLPTPLRVLARAVRECLQKPPTAQVQAELRRLDGMLGLLVAASPNQPSRDYRGGSPHEGNIPASREAILPWAQTYLNTPWMHTPWLTARLLTALLDAELARLTTQAPAHRSPSLNTLQCIQDEVNSGRYDRAETVRRLRLLESSGVYVHSFVYALLRLGQRSTSGT
jgi:hypothetical protein